MNIHVDTLEYSNDLEKAGLARPHAEAIAKLQARTVNDLIEHELVTKDDLKSELVQFEARTDVKLAQLESRLRDDIHDEMAAIRREIDGQSTTLRQEINGATTTLRQEINGVETRLHRQMDTLMLQIRALQLGGAIAAFSVGAIVLLSRLIR